MSVINPLARELSAKIVYYGPGMSGKTTSLASVHASLKPSHRGEMISLATEGDRTLYFDFLPVHMGKVQELDVRLQLYTVPGQVFYGATRRLVLEGADGVVFVADSQRDARERNQESLSDLRENLRRFGTPLEELPFVIQYNKRDLPNCMSLEELRQDLNTLESPDFATCASKGEGTTEALKAITRLVMAHLSKQVPVDPGASQRQALPLLLEDERTPDNRFESQVHDALRDIGHSNRSPLTSSLGGLSRSSPIPAAPDLNDLGQSNPPPKTVRRSSRGALRAVEEQPHEVQTIQAPVATPYSFRALFPDPSLLQQVEQGIATGQFAEAVYRAAGGVSGILDDLLGPYGAEGSATRAQLLGLEGHEYLKLRRLCSQPAAALTEEDALFALYVLIAVRIKETRLGGRQ